MPAKKKPVPSDALVADILAEVTRAHEHGAVETASLAQQVRAILRAASEPVSNHEIFQVVCRLRGRMVSPSSVTSCLGGLVTIGEAEVAGTKDRVTMNGSHIRVTAFRLK